MTTVSAPSATGVLNTLREEKPIPEGNNPAKSLTADFDTFLKLLTTQLKSQDPLQPLESTQFVAQLAQFSAVEQQIATNSSLSRILEAINGAGSGSLGDWLGRDVRAAAPLDHKGGPVEVFAPKAPAAALSASLVVRRGNGVEVERQPMELGAASAVWDGTLPNGEPAPPGIYNFEVVYALPDKATERKDAEVFVRVQEARRTDDGIQLALQGGGVVKAADVTAVREPRVTDPAG